MHPRYAAIFGIENLELNQHFRSDLIVEQVCEQSSTAQPLTVALNTQLFADLKRAVAPLPIEQVVQSDSFAWHNGLLSVPSSQLTADNKRALWALMSKHLDNL
ncbi:hypothetical protein [Pseudoalteromonas sp. ASV78]|uniref:hypothetical protein n=1 Tax=Pseudoalteromonas sp. ASV78 TaxID=3397851 RepID=UPI0039FBF02B